MNIPLSRELLLKYLAQLVPDDGMIAEVGVALGDFSRQILDTMQPARLILIDCWSPCPKSHPGQKSPKDKRSREEQRERYFHVCRRFLHDPRVFIIKAKSFPVAQHVLADNSFDLIYLDSNHFYPHVRKELPLYWSKVKPGGWFAGDDYVNNEWSGVKRAVDEFLRNRGLKLAMLSQDEAPTWALQKPE